MGNGKPKEKIAILGGGVGAMAAAFALTDGPNAEKYDITVYQLGWRLGGKGASGRNADVYNRIEEHGLHIWFGFYYNAVPLMRRCYAELTGDANAFEQAFTAHGYVVLEELVNGQWRHWDLPFPPNAAGPGTPVQFLKALLKWMADTLRTLPLPNVPVDHLDEMAWWPSVKAVLSGHGFDLAEHAAKGLLGAALATIEALGDDAAGHPVGAHDLVGWLVERARRWLQQHTADALTSDDTLRRTWIAIDLAAAAVSGMLADGVLTQGFDPIDRFEFREWLQRHGASPLTLESAPLRAIYGLAFAFRDGVADTAHAAIGAGTALRCTLRMLFGYDRTLMWKMQGGMGDVVFMPFYKVLKQRGVQFKFFHRVRSLHPAADGKSIETIRIGQQVRLKNAEYDPRVEVNGRECWPSTPKYGELHDDDAAALQALQNQPNTYVNLESHWSSWGPDRETEVVLQRGTHFDHVVLGISLGALPHICRDLVAINDDWRHMIERVKTVRTQGFQLWLNKRLEEYWNRPSPVLGAYVEPLDTWADMTHTAQFESWPAGWVQSIAYICGVIADDGDEPEWFTDPGFPGRQKGRGFDAVLNYLTHDVGYLWHNPQDPHGLDWNWLVDPHGSAGVERLKAQYWTVNVDPTERYVLSVPGSLEARLPNKRGTGFSNLYLAGDWTRNGINAGCVEAAVMSGLLASRAVSGSPATIIAEADFPK